MSSSQSHPAVKSTPLSELPGYNSVHLPDDDDTLQEVIGNLATSIPGFEQQQPSGVRSPEDDELGITSGMKGQVVTLPTTTSKPSTTSALPLPSSSVPASTPPSRIQQILSSVLPFPVDSTLALGLTTLVAFVVVSLLPIDKFILLVVPPKFQLAQLTHPHGILLARAFLMMTLIVLANSTS